MFGGSRGRLSAASICAVAVLGCAGVAACGDDGDEPSAAKKEEPTFLAASEPEHVFIKRVAKLLETSAAKKDCAQLEEINARSFTRFDCPAAKELRRSMASFEIVGSKEYGTGGVVDYKSGAIKDGAAIVLFVAPDRNWGIGRFGVTTKPSTETSDKESRAGYAKAVDAFLAAVRERDCAAFKKVAFTAGVEPKDVCKTTFPGTAELAKRLKANPGAKPAYEGGNGTYGFYKLETTKPADESSTISIVKSGVGAGASYLVLDVTPSPTSAELRQVVEQYKQQQKQGDPADMEPSSKPSDPAVEP